MRFRCSIELHPAIHCYHAKPFAVSGPFAIRGLPFFPREGSQRGSRHRAGAAGPRLRGDRFPEMIGTQRLARLDAPRKYTFRHLPPFVVCEDASVRDDWIVEPNNPYCFKNQHVRSRRCSRSTSPGWNMLYLISCGASGCKDELNVRGAKQLCGNVLNKFASDQRTPSPHQRYVTEDTSNGADDLVGTVGAD
jgi:hypothetical protein